MTEYELLYLIPAETAEDEVKKITSQVKNLITAGGGSIISDSLWAKRKLAYPIKQSRHAYFWRTEYSSDTKLNTDLTRELKLLSEVIRFMIVDRIPAELRKAQAEAEAASEAEAEAKPVMKSKPVEPKTAEPVVSARREESKVSLEDLDQKLDEILDQDIPDR
ncbi:MAG: 30S ribosomal protein S6 [bacterium]|nr:30S ribosomal protein S6 [bacterium]